MTHAYGGVEHKQPGPFKECLLCEVERLKDALRFIADPRTPSMTGGFTGQTKPASRLREIAREALAGPAGGADHLVYREEWERFDRWQRLRDTLEEVDFVGAEGFAADMVAAAQAEASRLREQRARCARLQQALREIAEIDERDDSRPIFFGLQNAFFKAQRIAREALAGPGSEQGSLTESDAGLPDTPADDRRCPELNPRSTSEDRCERPVGHSGDHVSVLHSGRMKVYPSKWDTPADSPGCQCPVGSYDRGNAVHADYCPLADSQEDKT